MRTSKFSNNQIQVALKKLQSGATVKELSKEMNVAVATIYNWKKRYKIEHSNLLMSNPNLKTSNLAEENQKLKQLVANLLLEKQDLLELLSRKDSNKNSD